MSALAAEWTTRWASQLADLADSVMSEVPDTDEWQAIRHFLSNTSRMLRRGDIKAGFRAVMRILPYVQGALSNAEKCTNIHTTFKLTESVCRHFLVDEAHKKNLDAFMSGIRTKLAEIRRRVERLAHTLDNMLDDVINKGQSVSWWRGLRLAFGINRIAALIRNCEDRLGTARVMIDELDSHVAAKSFLAYVFTYVTFLIGLMFSAYGNVPVGAACISTATLTRKTAKSLDKYRQELAAIDNSHRQLQAQLSEWKHKFHAEQRNFLLLFGPQKAVALLVAMVIIIYGMGPLANCTVFFCFVAVLFLKSGSTHSNKYNAILILAAGAAWLQYFKHLPGLFVFNSLGGASVVANFLGLSEFWW